jgi:serine/threonine protein kinase
MCRFLFSICITAIFLAKASLEASPESAQAIAKALWKQDHNIGLSRSQLEEVCLYIDKKASKKDDEQASLNRHTYLSCDIVRTTSPDGFMITHLPGDMRIGSGVHKVVMKALFYGSDPKIVAECLADESSEDEVEVLKQLQGCRGIVPYLGSVSRPNNTCTIYLEYIPGGSLTGTIHAGYPFTIKQKLKIAKDAMIGLKSMHDHNLVHRDLHGGNILLRKKPSGLFTAVLTDFGKTIDPRTAKEHDVPQAPKTRNPPETLIKQFSTIDRYAADVYAMGCNLYIMEWKVSVPWTKLYNVYSLHTYSPEKRARLHKIIAQQYKKLKKERIGNLLSKKRLTPRERFQILIFKMLSVSPEDRPTVDGILRALGKARA